MNRKQLIDYLQHRIECVETFLADCYTINGCRVLPEVVRDAETELRVLLEVLKEVLNEFYG